MMEHATRKSEVKKKEIKESKRLLMNLSKFFESQPEDFEVSYSNVFYSNDFNLKISSTELIIDFIQLPGEKIDDKMKINAMRVYLPYSVGKDLVDVMQHALK